MRTFLRILLTLILPIIIADAGFSQVLTPGNYFELSGNYLTAQRDSLKKALVCPNVYTKKDVQKKYKELWEARTSSIISSINDNDFIREPEMYAYISQLLKEIVAGNSAYIKTYPLLLIDRSSSVNAYALGNNIVAVNLGLLSFANYREEIALALAHELGHNILMHAEKSMKERAELLTSEEYLNEVNAVLDSKYGRYSKLKKILEGYSYGSSRHTRYHEEEADSMAVILLKNSHLAFDPAFFLRLDSADLVYKTKLKDPLKAYLGDINVILEDSWFHKGGKGLSNKNYSFAHAEISDSLKTHPDCVKRYEKLVSVASVASLTPVPAAIRAGAGKAIVWSLFMNRNLTAAMYRVFLEKDQGNFDIWYRVMESYIFNGLFYADKQLSRFNAINIKSKEYISPAYYDLQNMFEQIPRDKLEITCRDIFNQEFWQQVPAEERSFKSLLSYLNFSGEQKASEIKSLRKDFEHSFNRSLYREFIEEIK